MNIYLTNSQEPELIFEPEPLEKNTRSRSRLKKKSGAGAAKKLAGSPALPLYMNLSIKFSLRIGRTGRKNNAGTAYTFITEKNGKSASQLIQILTEAKQVGIYYIDTFKAGPIIFCIFTK